LDALTTLDDGAWALVQVSSGSPETLTFSPLWRVRGCFCLSGSITLKGGVTDTDQPLTLASLSEGSFSSLPNLPLIAVETDLQSSSCILYALKPFRPYLTDYYRLRLRLVGKGIQGVIPTQSEIVVKVEPSILNAYLQGSLPVTSAISELSSLQLLFYLLKGALKSLSFTSSIPSDLNVDDLVVADTLTKDFGNFFVSGWTGDEFKVEVISVDETKLEQFCQALRDALLHLHLSSHIIKTLTG